MYNTIWKVSICSNRRCSIAKSNSNWRYPWKTRMWWRWCHFHHLLQPNPSPCHTPPVKRKLEGYALAQWHIYIYLIFFFDLIQFGSKSRWFKTVLTLWIPLDQVDSAGEIYFFAVDLKYQPQWGLMHVPKYWCLNLLIS